MLKKYSVNRTTAIVLLIVLIIVIMIGAKRLLIPVTWSLIFSFIMYPVARRMEARRIPRVVSSLIATFIFMLIGFSILFFLVYESYHILHSNHVLNAGTKERIEESIGSLEESLGLNVFDPSQLFSEKNYKTILGWLAANISGLGEDIITLTLIPMYLFFILNYRSLLRKFIRSYYEGEQFERVGTMIKKSYHSIHQYLRGTLFLTVAAIVLTYFILLAFGVHYAFFFAVLLAILNLIPYIGNLVAFAIVLAFVWATKPGEYVLYVLIALYVSNIIQENFLRPKLVGDSMEVNAAVIFTAVFIGGLIWGFSGMVLFIPLAGIAKAIIDSNPKWQTFSIFFEST